MRIAIRALAVAVLALAAGCGSDTVDSGEVEQQIERQIASATTQVASVSCPSDVEKEEGDTFECDVELDAGGDAVVTVTQESGNDFAYEVKQGTMRVADDSLEPHLEDQLAGEGVSAQVNCPALVTVKAGTTATCDVATAGGREATVTFAWQDDAGAVDPSSVETTEE